MRPNNDVSESAPTLDEQTIEISRTLKRIHELIDLIELANNRWELERVRQDLKAEAETLNRLNKQLTESVQNKETKNMNRKSWIIISVLLMVMILFTGGAAAQEATLEAPTVEASTPAPLETPVVEVTVIAPDVPPVEPEPDTPPDPGFNIRDFLTGVVSGGAVVLAAIFGIIGRLKNDKAAQDAIEWLGKSMPIEALDKLNVLGRNMRDAGEVIDRVTDGKPNDLPPAAISRFIQRE